MRGAILSARPERVQLCVTALRLCLESDGAASKGTYEAWRASQPLPEEWPSSQAIKDTFGSWRKAKDAAGAIAFADVLDRELGGSEVAYSPDELVACIEAFGRTGKPLVWKEYHAFALEQMSRPDRELPRFFRECTLVHKHFKTWTRLLLAAGLGERMADEYAHRGATSGAREDYSEHACRRAVAACAACLGPEVTTRQYARWGLDREREARLRGEHLVVPRPSVIKRVLGPWPVALHKAGIISEQEMMLRRARGSAKRSDEELVADVAESILALGRNISRDEHDAYRLKLVRDGRHVMATATTIRDRLGGWPQANTMALDYLVSLGIGLDQLPARSSQRRDDLLKLFQSEPPGDSA